MIGVSSNRIISPGNATIEPWRKTLKGILSNEPFSNHYGPVIHCPYGSLVVALIAHCSEGTPYSIHKRPLCYRTLTDTLTIPGPMAVPSV